MSVTKISSALALTIPLLSGCASAPPEFRDDFATHIFDNGNKQFTYRLMALPSKAQKPKPQGDNHNTPHPEGKPDKGHKDARGKGGKKGRKDIAKQQKQLLAIGQEQLTVKLEESEYCREGFMLLDEEREGPRISLKGECLELASESDITQFPNTRSNVYKASTFSFSDRLEFERPSGRKPEGQ